jgi:hypothetical protein
MNVPTKYPRFIDIVTASPPVSPRVVAATLMIQNQNVTSGDLAERFVEIISHERFSMRI